MIFILSALFIPRCTLTNSLIKYIIIMMTDYNARRGHYNETRDSTFVLARMIRYAD